MSKDKIKKALRNEQQKAEDSKAEARTVREALARVTAERDRYRAGLDEALSALKNPGGEDRSLAFFMIEQAVLTAIGVTAERAA